MASDTLTDPLTDPLTDTLTDPLTDTLTDTAIRKATPGSKPVRMFDGRGSYLEVSPKGGKWWRLKFRFDGKEDLLALGTDPEVSLRKARDKREEARALLGAGVDPSAVRIAEKASRTGAGAGSSEAVAREFHETRRAQWSDPHAKRWLERLEKDVFPYLGKRALPDISAPLLLETLRRVEARGVRETVHSIMQACGQVLRYGIATGRGERNPASDFRGALRPVLVKSMAAVTEPAAVGALLRATDDYQRAADPWRPATLSLAVPTAAQRACDALGCAGPGRRGADLDHSGSRDEAQPLREAERQAAPRAPASAGGIHPERPGADLRAWCLRLSVLAL